jgi:nitrite reductase (NADH) small subunit
MVPATEMSDEEFEFTEEVPAVSLAEVKQPAAIPALTVTNVASKKAVQVMVCNIQDLTKGVGYPATVKGKALAIFLHSDGRVFAIDAVCPHAGGPMEEGTMSNCEVTCPLHEYKFDLTSGRCSTDPSLVLQTYPVFIEDNQVWVEIHI